MSPQSRPDFMAWQSSVPLFSGQAGEGLFVMATLWTPGFGFVLFLTGIDIDILSWVLMTLVAAFLMSSVWSYMRRRRFRNLARDPELLSLFEEVRRDLGTGHDIELWHRDIDRQVFIWGTDVFFKAILFSDSAIGDLIAKREKGKVLLAKAVLDIEKKHPVSRFLAGVLFFTAVAFFESFAFFDLTEVLVFSFGTALIALILLAVLGLFVAVPIVASRKSTKIDDTIERLYGTPPDAAMMDVLYGLPVPDEMIAKARHGHDEAPSRRRKFLRNGAIAAIIAAPVSFTAFMLLGIYSILAVPLSLFMAVITAAGAFFIVTLGSVMWPLLTMGRGPRSTEWDIELPFAQEIQGFLNRQEVHEKLSVRGVKPPYDSRAGLVILRIKPNYQEETLHVVMPQMLEDLQDVELLGPLILADLRIQQAESRERRVGYRALAIAAPILVIGLVWSVVVSGIEGLLYSFIPILVIYLVITAIPAAYMTSWRRKAVVNAEVEIAREYPAYREALRTLIKNHYTLPYGMASYKTRLERIDRQLEIRAERDIGI